MGNFNKCKHAKDYVRYYCALLAKEYPDYTVKELYCFIMSAFKYFLNIAKNVDRNTENFEIRLGPLGNLRFLNERYNRIFDIIDERFREKVNRENKKL